MEDKKAEKKNNVELRSTNPRSEDGTSEVKKDKVETSESKKGRFQYKYLGLGIALLLVVVLAVVIGFSGDREVAAKVGGEKIYVSDIEALFNSIPPEQQSSISKKDILDSLVNSKVLFIEAKKNGYKVGKDEAESQIENLMVSSGMNKEQLLQNLEAQGIDERSLVKNIIEQMTIQNYLDAEISNGIEVSDEEIEDYYSRNIQEFEQGETVTVKHILVEGQDEANELLNGVNAGNFCDFVEEHSTDVVSVPDCGEYSFGRNDPYVQEFKDLSFSQNVGDIGTAETQFGTHVIWTVSKSDAGIVSFSEVKTQIEDLLKREKAGQELAELSEKLKEEINIKIYYGLEEEVN
tara:strand:+ start:641 stop:1687 length:1047 start_codon:yes stop_codon:yes gene_type:complete